jgi:cytoskeletal protein CcmA (bactofilin family)
MAKTYEQNTPAINIIRQGTEILGDIKCKGDIRIDGKLTGTLICEGKLVIGETGTVEGEIACKNADISGKIIGKIEVNELLLLKNTSDLIGDIFTGKLSVEPGAKFTGTCTMSNAPKSVNNNGVAEKESKLVEETA